MANAPSLAAPIGYTTALPSSFLGRMAGLNRLLPASPHFPLWKYELVRRRSPFSAYPAGQALHIRSISFILFAAFLPWKARSSLFGAL